MPRANSPRMVIRMVRVTPQREMSSNDGQRCSSPAKALRTHNTIPNLCVVYCKFSQTIFFKHDDIRVIVNSTMNRLQTEERADADRDGAVRAHAQVAHRARPSNPSITARPSPDEKARFTLIARHVGLSESALALRAIRLLLDRDEQWLARQPNLKWNHVAARDRITVRLRPGDGLEVIRRAVLAMPAGTPPDKVLAAARAFAGKVQRASLRPRTSHASAASACAPGRKG